MLLVSSKQALLYTDGDFIDNPSLENWVTKSDEIKNLFIQVSSVFSKQQSTSFLVLL